MAVYDRWHTKRPRPGAEPCREHSRGKVLYPSADHGKGDRWQVRWRDEDGKQCKANRPKRGGTKDEVDPEIYAEALDAQIQHGLNSDDYTHPSAGKVTLQEYARQWRAGLTLGPTSLETVDKHLAHIYDVQAGPRSRRAPGKSMIGPRGMRQLAKRPSVIQQWIKSLEAKGLSSGYISVIVSTLSQIFNAAMDDGIVSANPVRARSVRPPKVDRAKKVPWTMAMVDAAAAEIDRRHDSGAMAYLGAGAGLREGEIFGISPDDVEWLGRDRMIHVRRQVLRSSEGALYFALPKGGKTRDVPLSDELGLRLAAQLKAAEPVEITLPWGKADGPPRKVRLFFLGGDGRPWYRQKFQYTWGRAREAAGAPVDPHENGIHVLRHTAASAWLAGGVDIRTLADWLGHEDPGFTLRTYTHLMPNAADKGRKAMDAFMSAPGASAPNVPQADEGGS